MASRPEVLQEILSLPEQERRELASALLESLARGGEASLSAEEEAELVARMEAADAGDVVPAAEVLRQLDARRSPR